MAAYLMSVYRLGQIDRSVVGVYYQTLEKKIQDMLNVDPFKNPGMMSNLVPKYDNWSSSTLFSRLVAAYDRILIKCPAP